MARDFDPDLEEDMKKENEFLNNVGTEKQEDQIAEAVDPKHYKEIVPGYEYFDLMDHILKDFKGTKAHALGNAYKYLMRLEKKDNPVQELGKAIWYLERLKSYYEQD